MASPVPQKLQPLHNFLHTHLKWKQHRSGRSRLAGEASSSSNPWLESPPLRSHTHASSSSPYRTSPLHKQLTVHDSEFIERTSKRKISESSIKSDDYDNKRKRSNEISIRIDEENHASTPVDDESSPKIWNLRPRRLPVNHQLSAGGFPKIGTSRLKENITSHDKLPELNDNSNGDTRTTELPIISISLSRGEIEEDLSFLTGSKPSRRPKKRPRAIQKQLDNLFPGLWLDSISVDSYKVSETPSKG